MQKLILASSSVYRKAQLQQLGLPFECCSPDIDEQAQPGEGARALVLRLALAKAQAVAARQGDPYIIIGSDQVAYLNGDILTKPGDHASAVKQLSACSGQQVVFYTGLAVLKHGTSKVIVSVTETHVGFRVLTPDQIQSYLLRETPYDCAGSFKCEGLGIALFESIDSSDPSALIGLPLISLVSALTQLGLDPVTS